MSLGKHKVAFFWSVSLIILQSLFIGFFWRWVYFVFCNEILYLLVVILLVYHYTGSSFVRLCQYCVVFRDFLFYSVKYIVVSFVFCLYCKFDSVFSTP